MQDRHRNQAIGAAIRRTRESKHLSLRATANRLRITHAHLSRVEAGYKPASATLIERLEDLFDLPKGSIVAETAILTERPRDQDQSQVVLRSATLWVGLNPKLHCDVFILECQVAALIDDAESFRIRVHDAYVPAEWQFPRGLVFPQNRRIASNWWLSGEARGASIERRDHDNAFDIVVHFSPLRHDAWRTIQLFIGPPRSACSVVLEFPDARIEPPMTIDVNAWNHEVYKVNLASEHYVRRPLLSEDRVEPADNPSHHYRGGTIGWEVAIVESALIGVEWKASSTK